MDLRALLRASPPLRGSTRVTKTIGEERGEAFNEVVVTKAVEDEREVSSTGEEALVDLDVGLGDAWPGGGGGERLGVGAEAGGFGWTVGEAQDCFGERAWGGRDAADRIGNFGCGGLCRDDGQAVLGAGEERAAPRRGAIGVWQDSDVRGQQVGGELVRRQPTGLEYLCVKARTEALSGVAVGGIARADGAADQQQARIRALFTHKVDGVK
jgi:hypothetical protein